MKSPRFQINSHGLTPASRLICNFSGSSRQRCYAYNVGYNKCPSFHGVVQASGFCKNRAFHQQVSPKRTLASSPTLPSYHRSLAPKHSLSTNSSIKKSSSSATNSMTSEGPIIHDLFESKTGTWQYVVADPTTLSAVIIDPVLDFDRATQVITTKSADSLLSVVKDNKYKVVKILETHAHADHLTAAAYLQKRLTQVQGHRPPISIGKRIPKVQKLFGGRYGILAEEYQGVFDHFFEDDEKFDIGNMQATAIHLPGHTPDHLGYMIGDNVFCGDSLFHPDIGTARCDFPGGSANDLFNSGRKLLALPDHVKIWVGHDYPPTEREGPVAWRSVGEHREQNRHLRDGVTQEEFVALRTERDSNLAAPRLIHQSLQINVRGGRLPKPTEVGQRMLHVPLQLKEVAEW